MLNEVVARAGELGEDAVFETELQIAFEQLKSSTPVRSKVKTYTVIFNDGKNQETRFLPNEISSWVATCNADAAKENKSYRVVRILDEDERVVWPE